MFDEGHIPGATFVDLEADLSAGAGPGRHPLPDPAAFTRRLGELGFGNDHAIVVYDDAGGTVAARLWWMLDALGHRDVRLLDGGIQAWVAAGGALETESEAKPVASLRLATGWPRILDRAAIRDRRPDRILVDMRAGERYRGEVEPVDPVAGHIPTARSAPAGDLLGPDGRFLPPQDLREQFATLGCSESEVVTSCGSGVTACQTALAMRVAGLPDPTVYPGSFSDWSRAGEAVATGSE